MKEDIVRLELKVDKVIEVNNRQDVHLAKLSTIAEQNKEILDEHMARTAANEQRIELVERSIDKHLSFIQGAIKIAGLIFGTIVTIIGVLGGLVKMGVISF